MLAIEACCVCSFLLGLILLPCLTMAQAWVPEKGTGVTALTFQDNLVKDHLTSTGKRVDAGHIRTVILLEDIDYGITDKLAANVSIPFVLSRYYATSPQSWQPHQLPVDNGNFHGNFQDLRLNVRYNLRTHPFLITPFAGLGVPSTDYI